MFTGLVQATGRILEVSPEGGGVRVTLSAPLSRPQLGESVAINGVCLTLEHFNNDQFVFFIGQETLAKSHLNKLKAGDLVNVEQSMQASDRVGGHFVSGHVDDTGQIKSVKTKESCIEIVVQFDPVHGPLVISKGSISLNGVSLTINDVASGEFSIFLIPETVARTNLGSLAPGDIVNLEFDVFAKTVAHQLRFYQKEGGSLEQR